MILMIDNYDSFTYNLVQYLGELGEELVVKRNDQITIEEIELMQPTIIMVSPGPCSPNEAGISLEAISYFAGKIPVFGVCLGHQSIGQAFGGDVIVAERLMHGKTSPVYHDGKTTFKGMPNPFIATRYHSLIVKKETLPDCFEISA
ncbi:glutamine amidotransferase-related protein, partial [Peribacillus acanthi]|uniref:glutamine amidotransferase-related protein n=1 Tax=Peribacillus acanthi TaxID=2171554 RepID=UPI001F0BCDC7